MAQKNPPPQDDQEKKEQAPAAANTRDELDELRDRLPERTGLAHMVQDLIRNKDNMTEDERKKQIGAIMALAALRLAFEKNEAPPKEAPAESTGEGSAKNPQATAAVAAGKPDDETDKEGDETEKPKEPSREKRRKVVCNDLRLICINTDPAGSRRPSHLAGKSTYLVEYGLPEFETFKEEMISILAPNTKDEGEGLKKAISVLRASPMGKYQCMPQYLFKDVPEFKKYNLDWRAEGQDEEKLRAIWEFLQHEEMQRAACRGYVQSTIGSLKKDPRFNNDPRYIYASYYGGLSAGLALLARDTDTATEKQRKRVEKKQGVYVSIEKYSSKQEAKKDESGKLVRYPEPNVEAIVSGIAGRESGSLEGKKSKARDETWEQDQRYAYNRTGSTDTNNAVA